MTLRRLTLADGSIAAVDLPPSDQYPVSHRMRYGALVDLSCADKGRSDRYDAAEIMEQFAHLIDPALSHKDACDKLRQIRKAYAAVLMGTPT